MLKNRPTNKYVKQSARNNTFIKKKVTMYATKNKEQKMLRINFKSTSENQ